VVAERTTESGEPADRLGPRDRILVTARALFYRQGIHATGVEQLAEAAGVSKRTLYQLFGSKDGLVAAYLTWMSEHAPTNERYLRRVDLTPRERLLALFGRPTSAAAVRGCPIHNAAVEITNPRHPGAAVIHAHKEGFLRQLVDTATQAGAPDPETLGRQLFVLFEGATALGTSTGELASYDYARPVAQALVDQALVDQVFAAAAPAPRPANAGSPEHGG
jgi:AcrR family transcriptional regulator